MKKLIILSAVLFGLHSCDSTKIKESQKYEAPRKLDKDSRYYDRNYEIYTLDGCEYIVVGAGGMKWGSHKGDCKNLIHLHNGEVHPSN
jgi:hypothetical protein